MKLHEYFIMVLVFSLLVVVPYAAVVNISDNYADIGETVTIDETKTDVYDKTSTINDDAENIEESLTGSDIGGEDSSTTFFGGAWNSIQIVFGSVGIAKDLIIEVGSLFHIPPVIIGTLISMFIITLFFASIYMIFKHTGET
jgi:hypothetical protein